MAVAETQDSAAQRASGSSFYTAMRIMPKAQREAMFEIYSFCRKVDDIADDGGPRDERLDQLRLWRSDIDALYKGSAVSRAQSLAAPIKTFKLRREDFQAVIDGMEMDVVADIRAPDWATLDALLRPRRERGRAAVACASSAWRRRPASRSPIISAARCN